MALAPQKNRQEAPRKLVGFVVGDVTYAVEIASVREIVSPLALTALPHTPPAIAGVADHRGEVVPIVDLRIRFGLPAVPLPTDRRVKWILVGVGMRTVGLVVDGGIEVFGVPASDLRPAPDLGGGEDARGISSVTTLHGGLAFVLDLARLEALTEPLARAVLGEPPTSAGRG